MNKSHSQNISSFIHIWERWYTKKSYDNMDRFTQYEKIKCASNNGSLGNDVKMFCSGMPPFTCTNIHWAGRKNYMLGASPAGPSRAFNRGWRALTTMLIFGRKSASYCTHKAATAAICNEDKMSSTVRL